VHLVLAIVLTLFLAVQTTSLVAVLRARRAPRTAIRRRRPADLLWTSIPVLVVLFLVARSWVAVFDVERPAIASPTLQAKLGLAQGETPR
jgi:heme/copper-type cytochrome/quinol oxidase subunit 2